MFHRPVVGQPAGERPNSGLGGQTGIEEADWVQNDKRGQVPALSFRTCKAGDQPPVGAGAVSAGGVKPMTWTPAPRAMSIASTTSRYCRFRAVLRNMSFAGRLS